MPLQNRVLPTGEIVADPARGMFTGNRGILAFEGNRLTRPRWKHRHWIICDLTHPKGRYHGPRPARGWTPLFFLDEAAALAAGHRPCAYCRPDAYAKFKSAWARAHGAADHDAIDRALHAARVTRARSQVTHRAEAAALPDGTFIALDGESWLVFGEGVLRYSPAGYGGRRARPSGQVIVLTPAPTIATLAQGYQPVLHGSVHA